MTDYERGPRVPYLVKWHSGQMEVIKAHQVLIPQSSIFDTSAVRDNGHFTFHAEVHGEWTMLLSVSGSLIASVRKIDTPEVSA